MYIDSLVVEEAQFHDIALINLERYYGSVTQSRIVPDEILFEKNSPAASMLWSLPVNPIEQHSILSGYSYEDAVESGDKLSELMRFANIPSSLQHHDVHGLNKIGTVGKLNPIITVAQAETIKLQVNVKNIGTFVENSYQLFWRVDNTSQTPIQNAVPLEQIGRAHV